ncbi:PKD domain-containing protein, partial [Bacteroidales bacterium OttesenSCG-928-K22]|nr:PKD domain-containing protein [Bacteroidales bacterium OttesenSCG-928-K22]
PWDNKNSLSADDSWWQYVCREYADTVHVYNSSYMTYLNNGITRGYSWYSISGSRQDYANYYDHCREFCLEISNNKTPSASQLPNFWNWNYRSFLNYIEQALYGIHGTVTDANTGLPLKCEVKIENHDRTESQVYSNPETGYYVRPIKAGTYTISYIKQGYETVNQIITISDKQKIIHDVQLNYAGMTASFSANNTNVNLIANNQVNFTDESFSLNPITQYSWTFEGGNPNTSNDKNPIITYDEEGSYYVSLTISDGTNSSTLTKEDYISVSSYYIMQNGSFEINEETTFYDSGGKDENYSNNENYTISFLPTSKNKALTVTFTDFDVEYHGSCNYDYLLIYDGSDISYPLLGKFCGSTIPGPFTSSADNGALTFVFHSDVADTGSGWKAIIENKSTTAPTADFSSENTFIVANSDIAFIDKSLNDPIEWEWTFEGGTPETSNEQNPTITYQQAGNFDVTLKVKNEYGEDVITKTDYIQVALSIKTLENNIKIYPNPAKDAINIQAETLIEEIEIIDLAGRKVNEVNIKDTNTIIDITNIPAGLYIINIQLENSSYSTKILIND